MFDIDELLNVLVIVYTVMEMEIFYFVYAYNLYNIILITLIIQNLKLILS